MQYLIQLVIFVTLISHTLVAQEAGDEKESKKQLNERKSADSKRDKDQFYERMAANSFALYTEFQYSDLPDKDKKAWLRNGAASAFSYWVSTRKGDIQASTIVDLAIAMFYEEAVKGDVTSVFSDPLLRFKSNDPESVGISGFPRMSQDDYTRYTKEFKEYLESILKRRANRQK
jgi:hypothetical protein